MLKNVCFVFCFLGMLSELYPKVKNSFEGSINPGFSYDTNFYKNHSELAATTLSLETNLKLKTRFTRNTSTRLEYNFGLEKYTDADKEFDFTASSENNSSHRLSFQLKQRLGELFLLDIPCGYGIFQQPNYENETLIEGTATTIRYNSQSFNFTPEINYYFLDHTTLKAGYLYNEDIYKDYDLDSKSNGIMLKISQDISLSSYLDISGLAQTKNYSERRIYKSTDTTSKGAFTDEERQDKITNIGLSFTKNISKNLKFALSPGYQKLDSNANWPELYRISSTAVSRKLKDDFYDYTRVGGAVNVGWGALKGTLLNLSGSYYQTKYDERLAKDEYYYKKPEEKRLDKKNTLSLNVTQDIAKNVAAKFGYTYQKNSTNDFIYDYESNKFSTSLMCWF